MNKLQTGKVVLGGALLAIVGVAGAAERAGSLARVEGAVLINKGEQYVKAREGTRLNTGDRLMVMDNSSAIVKYDEGCHQTLGANEILTVAKNAACSTGEAGSRKVDPYYAAAITAPAANLGWVPVAGAGAIGAAVAADEATGANDDNGPSQLPLSH